VKCISLEEFLAESLPKLTGNFWFDGLGDLGVKLAEQLRRGSFARLAVSFFAGSSVQMIESEPNIL